MNKKYLICLDFIYVTIFIIMCVLMLIIGIDLKEINNKLNELIQLNTPEVIKIVPENYIL